MPYTQHRSKQTIINDILYNSSDSAQRIRIMEMYSSFAPIDYGYYDEALAMLNNDVNNGYITQEDFNLIAVYLIENVGLDYYIEHNMGRF